ncbi:uncharacterized protein LOC128787454 [Vidua chalybeata]|uniref:uncharacterized protein LOC128787454 n=1 Tax=Vidua chalybeata TaxID=81927 RepID=UPI0023A888C0|nr:uncharacterized protein LOC128787454 [Vidua chalybeata]
MVKQNAAEKRPPGKEQEADAKSSSRLSGQPRPDKIRRRSWRQRVQDSGIKTGKPIRLNRVPLLRAETSSLRTTTQEVSGLSQGVVPVSSSSKSCSSPCRKQALKRGHPQGAREPQAPESPLAKRRRMDDVPAQSAKTSSFSTSSQVASRLSQDSQSSRRQTAPYRPPWLFLHPQPGPIRMRHIWQQQRREKKPYSRPQNQSRTRGASVPGPRPPHPSK